MTELINLQHQMLLVSLTLGVGMGLTYDLLRCFRRIIPQSLLIVSIEDFLFWFIWTMVIIDSIVRFNYGEIRIYIFLFLTVGFIVYKTTIGWVLMKVFNYMWYGIKNCLHNAKKNLKKTRNNSKI